MAGHRLSPVLRHARALGGGTPPASLDDSHLLDRFARDRDEAAFAALVRRHGPMVLGVCRRVLRDRHAADDAFQATFLLLARKAGSLRQPERLGPWLHGVARRTAAKARAIALRRRRREAPVADVPAAAPADELIWRDLRPVLDDAIGRLPPRYRTPVVLCYLQGLTYTEAARRLRCPPGTVATRLARARDRLRVRLTRQGLAPSAGLLAAALTVDAASAALPPLLLGATVRAAVAFVTDTAAGTVPAAVLTLTEGVGRMALLNPWKLGLAAVVMAGVAGTGAGVWTLRARAEVPPAQPETARQPPPQAVQAAVAVSQDEARRPNVVRTQNFAVMAPTAAAAQRVAVVAERERKAQALRWLGREMPPWPKPCPVSVNLMPGGAGGATKFNYDFRGGYEILGMDLTGELDRILKSTLPHEVTHTVLADYFRRPVPRWADEGAATLAESGPDQETHEQLVRQYLAKHKTLPLRRLFDLKDYTDVQDVLTVYAQGYSVTRFLVGRKDHATFLRFVEQGLSGRWDAAAKACYDFNSVQSLEAAWLADLDRAREAERPVPLAHLRQKQPDSYLLDAGDVLGVFVEGVLGERGQDPPLIRMTQAVPPGAASLPPALGYPIPVQEGGTLILPRIEPLAVRGKSINQAHDSIRAAYQRAQAVQPGARILVTLARRRTYRVTVIRRDKPADDPRRPVATTLDLPAYENDVLEALARSGGLPGWDANQVLVIERDRAATAGAEPQRVRIPLRVRPGQTPPFRPEDVILKNGDTLVVGDNDTELSPVGGTTTRPSRPAATTAARAEPPRPTDEPAPLPAVASLDPQGRIYAVWSARYMVSLPVPPPPKGAADGQQGAAPLYQVRIEGISSEALIEPERLRAFTADGKPVSTTALVERVREPTQVLVTWVGSLPDPFHRRLLKDDTLILLMPAAAAQPKPAGPAATPGQ